MSYTGLQTSLLVEAGRYSSLGYRVGYALGKSLVGPFEEVQSVPTFWGPMQQTQRTKAPDEWDGISLLLDGLVCVDFDTPDFDVGWGRPLPSTLKEKSPRGHHLFYRLPDGVNYDAKIKWQPHIDLLVRSADTKIKKKYGKSGDTWGNHVICHPTPGYKRIWPDVLPNKNQLTMAPDWILEELSK